MKVAVFIYLVVVFGNAFVADALTCFLCIGSDTSDCYNGITASMSVQICTNIGPLGIPPFVRRSISENDYQEVCVSISETKTIPETYVKGCVVLPKRADPCTFIRTHLSVSSCRYCTTTLCNGYAEPDRANQTVTTKTPI